MTRLVISCFECDSEGRIGDMICPRCDGQGSHLANCNECGEEGVGFNDDGEFLCEDCLFEWQCEEFGE